MQLNSKRAIEVEAMIMASLKDLYRAVYYHLGVIVDTDYAADSLIPIVFSAELEEPPSDGEDDVKPQNLMNIIAQLDRADALRGKRPYIVVE